MSGGILMDIAADRFVALSPLSAVIWSGLTARQRMQELAVEIMKVKGVNQAQAELVITRQLARWEQADLLERDRAVVAALPTAKVPAQRAATEVGVDEIRRARLSVSLMARLFGAERAYRRALKNIGLARTLSLLQAERSESAQPGPAVILRTLHGYRTLRLAFKQGATARDCLLRSIALAAVLRRQGVEADLCIGVIDLPFLAHAWVEAQGLILNETLSQQRRYTVIGRF